MSNSVGLGENRRIESTVPIPSGHTMLNMVDEPRGDRLVISTQELREEEGEPQDGIGGDFASVVDVVWCEECGVHNIGECFIHGGTLTLAQDNTLPSRAVLSLPKVLSLKRVRIGDPCDLESRKGVFAKKAIKLRTMFGPMEAESCSEKARLPACSLEYVIVKSTGEMKHLDTSDEGKCNWMMFVRPATTYQQQNLAAFLKDDCVYFVTIKMVPAGTELRVWYAAAYAKAIGKRMLLPDISCRKRGFLKQDRKIVGSQTLSKPEVAGTSKQTCSLPMVPAADTQNCLMPSKADEGKASQVLSTETAIKSGEPRDCSNMFPCNWCNATFLRPSQLDNHVCQSIKDVEEESFATRRRKGRPRKLPDNELSAIASKTFKRELDCSTGSGLQGNIPNEEIMNPCVNPQGKELEANKESVDIAEMEVLGTSENFSAYELYSVYGSGSDSKSKRGRGRPKGSKNKVRCLSKRESKRDAIASKRRPTYNCQHCDKQFTNREQHLIHEAIHTNTLPFPCKWPGCNKAFNSKFKFERHQMVHTKPNNYKCKFCPSTFTRIDHLKIHLHIHDSNRKMYTCQICGKSYLYKFTLTFHMAKHAAQDGTSLTCLICEKKFNSRDDLLSHVNTHNRYKPQKEVERSHKCGYCDKSFSNSKGIKRHMVTHTKERSFLCERCSQTFVRKDHLVRHYATNHKKEFYEIQRKTHPFGCEECLLVFKKQEFMDYHVRTAHPNGILEKDSSDKQEKSLLSSNGLCKIKDLKDDLKAVMKTKDDSTKLSESHGNVAPTIDRQSHQKHLQLQMQKVKEKPPQSSQSLLTMEVMQPQQVQPQQELQQQQQQQLHSQAIHQGPLPQQAFPVSLIKVQSTPAEASITMPKSNAAAFVYPVQMPTFEPEEISVDLYSTNMKTVPFRFQNEVSRIPVSQVSTTTTGPQQPHQQQQQQQQQMAEVLVKPTGQLQSRQLPALRPRLPLVNQQQQSQPPQPQPQLSQTQQQQQLSLLQGVQMSDVLSNLSTLSGPDIASASSASVLNFISVNGTSIVVAGQNMSTSKPVQWTVVKDSSSQDKASALKSEPCDEMNIMNNTPGIFSSVPVCTSQRPAQPVKPDHSYANASSIAQTITPVIVSQEQTVSTSGNKSNLQQQQQQQLSSISEEEMLHIVTGLRGAAPDSSGTNNLVNYITIADNEQIKLLPSQQHLHPEQMLSAQTPSTVTLQQQQHSLPQLSSNLQHQQQPQAQDHVALPSFPLSWAENISDFPSVSDLPISADAPIVQAVDSSERSNWVIQLPVMDQSQQYQNHGHQNPQILSVTIENKVPTG
ncbi:uncharacterized protein LOC101847918 isoform X2 [Aplysia californica]|nr:uncharacterized protein LOC101847918 isoform X2 [Aplysia californica]